jgi:hypothetical protein
MNRNLLVVGIQKITQNRVQGFKARYFRRILTPILSPDGGEGGRASFRLAWRRGIAQISFKAASRLEAMRTNFFVLVLCASLIGCVSPDRRASLLGSWVWDDESVIVNLTFSGNHEYRMRGWTRDAEELTDAAEAGQWRLQGRKLFLSVEASPLLPQTEGKRFQYEIIKLDNNALVLKGRESLDKPEETMTVTRVK